MVKYYRVIYHEKTASCLWTRNSLLLCCIVFILCSNFADNHAEHEQLKHDLEGAEQHHIDLRQEIEDCKRAVNNHQESANQYSREQRQIS